MKHKSFKNKNYLIEECGCYYCFKIFQVSEIKEWTDEGQTAICPYCNIDSVIPKEDEQFIKILEEYNKKYFSRTKESN